MISNWKKPFGLHGLYQIFQPYFRVNETIRTQQTRDVGVVMMLGQHKRHLWWFKNEKKTFSKNISALWGLGQSCVQYEINEVGEMQWGRVNTCNLTSVIIPRHRACGGGRGDPQAFKSVQWIRSCFFVCDHSSLFMSGDHLRHVNVINNVTGVIDPWSTKDDSVLQRQTAQ